MLIHDREPSLLRCRLLGLAGSVVTAGGGLVAGVPPARDPFEHLRGPTVPVVLVGLTMLLAAWRASAHRLQHQGPHPALGG